MWKKLIDLGTFNENYSQRINASFQYLNREGKHQFSLKDLIENGYEIFSYLSIDVEEDSSFAVMDLFRLFDRSGRGTVNIKEFVTGIIEKLVILRKNNHVMNDIADELINLETRPAELANKLDKIHQSNPNNPNYEKMPIFRRNFKAMASVFVTKLRKIQTKSNENSVLNTTSIISLLQSCVDGTVSEVQLFFHHFPSIPTATAPTTPRASSSGSRAMVWDLGLPRMAADKNSVDAHMNRGNHALLSHLLKEGTLGDSSDDDDTTTEGERAMSTARARQRSASGAADMLSHSSAVMSGGSGLSGTGLLYEGLPNDLFQSLGVNVGEDLLQILKGLKDVDDSQLFLLQTAFRSIDNYFSLSVPGEDGDHSTTGDHHSTNNEVQTAARHAKYREIGRSHAKKDKQITDSNNNTTQSEHTIDLITSTTNNNTANNNATTRDPGFEFALVQDLFESQDQLRKARMRMNVLEMVQSQMLGNSNYYDHLAALTAAEEAAALEAADEHSLSALPREHEDNDSLQGSTAELVVDIDDLLGNTGASDSLTFQELSKSTLKGLVEQSEAQPTTYENIISELCTLKACLAERALSDYPLGCLLEKEVAVVSLVDLHSALLDGENNSTSKPKSHQIIASDSTFNSNSSSLFSALKDLTKMTKDMHDKVYKRAHTVSVNESLVSTIKTQEDKTLELRSVLEQSEIERNEFMSLSIELQILREKNQKLGKEENMHKKLLSKNTELVRYSKELEETVNELRNKKNSTASDNKSDSKQLLELKHTISQLENKLSDVLVENDRNSKEVVRLKNSIIISEQRLKGALSDHMTLHHQKEQVEEEAANSKATITKLTRELEDSKLSRHYREDSERRMAELQREINKRDIELVEFKDAMLQIGKYQSELSEAERIIELLETQISEYTYDLERGRQAIKEIEGCREAARVKSKEIRDKDLHIHGLEAQLKELPGLHTRYGELMEEVNACKMKMENIPRLLSEIAQLRGVSRANVKAQTEDSKKLASLSTKMKRLEQDNARLNRDNMSMQELEMKLKETNAENKALRIQVAEFNTLKVTMKHTQEENKVLEGNNKAMRKHMRQSVLQPQSPLPSQSAHKIMIDTNLTHSSSSNNLHSPMPQQTSQSPQRTAPSSGSNVGPIDENSVDNGNEDNGGGMSKVDIKAQLAGLMFKKGAGQQ